MESALFLFDRYRTGRLLYEKKSLDQPEAIWDFTLPSFPVKCPESTPVFDDFGNLYFGSHDSCFYSLTKDGILRWFFKATKKIYSSPLIYGNIVCFADAGGHFFGLTLDGIMAWHIDLGHSYRKKLSKQAKLRDLVQRKIKNYSSTPRNLWDTTCWSSPNVDYTGTVYITGYGIGLHAIDIETGKVKWEGDLGYPRNHLSGVAINEHNEIFVASQQNRFSCYLPDGKLKWIAKLPKNYDSWSNPSIDPENKIVYVPVTKLNGDAILYTFDYSGSVRWQTVIPSGTRGSVAISYENYALLGAMNGNLYFIDKHTGKIIRSLKLGCDQLGLWTTPSIDKNGYVFVSTKESSNGADSEQQGSVVCLDKEGKFVWKHQVGKAYSTPIIDRNGRLYAGSWKGKLFCFQT